MGGGSCPYNCCQCPASSQPACQFPPPFPTGEIEVAVLHLPGLSASPISLPLVDVFAYRASDEEHRHSPHDRKVPHEWFENHP